MSIILGAEVDNIGAKQALKQIEGFLTDGKQHYIVTPNPEIVLYAAQEKNSDFRRFVLNQADLKIPDGIGLLLASWLLGRPLRRRLCGADLMLEICQIAALKGERIFLFGAETAVAEKCRQNLMEKFPGLKIAGVLDGYGKKIKNQKAKRKNINQNLEFNSHQLAIYQINQARPDILFVALGAPQQEKFIAENLKNMPSVKLAMAVGGSFDFIAGRIRRAPRLWRRLGLEWLWRLVMEPWRVKRIFNATIKFLLTVINWRLRMIFALRRNAVACIIKKQVLSDGNLKSYPRAVVRQDNNFQVLIVRRHDLQEEHWQLPQGGIDRAESDEQAIGRELFEELGLPPDFFGKQIKIIKKVKNFYRYIWPKEYRRFQGWRGQRQTLFILEWQGDDAAFKLDQKELADFKWVDLKNLTGLVHEARREQAEKILALIYRFFQDK